MYNVPHLRVGGKETLSSVFDSKRRVVNLLWVHPLHTAQGTSETLLYTNAQSTAEKTKEILEHGLQNVLVQSTSVYFNKKITDLHL